MSSNPSRVPAAEDSILRFDADGDYRRRLAEVALRTKEIAEVRNLLVALGAIIPPPTAQKINELGKEPQLLIEIFDRFRIPNAKQVVLGLLKIQKEEPEALSEKLKALNLAEMVWSIEEVTSDLKNRPDVQARLSIATQYTTSKWVLEQELKHRGKWMQDDTPPENLDAYIVASKDDAATTGICLSGGGIRSATFNLGVLQGIARRGALSRFHYLSSVSGGGYIHQFLACWIRQRGNSRDVQSALNPIPSKEKTSRGDARVVSPGPIGWLRRYSNYLSPSVGIFGTDMWTIAAVWVRNTTLNLIVLLPTMLFVLLLPHIFVSRSTFVHDLGSGEIFPIGATITAFAVMLIFLFFAFPEFSDARRDVHGKPLPQESNLRASPVRPVGFSVLLAAIVMANPVYRSSVPGGFSMSPLAQEAYVNLLANENIEYNTSYKFNNESHLEQLQLNIQSQQKAPSTRLRNSWSKYHPRWIWPPVEPSWPWESAEWKQGLKGHKLEIEKDGRTLELFWPLAVFPLGCGLISMILVWRIKENHRVAKVCCLFIAPFVNTGLAVLLLHGVRLLFFALSFAVSEESVPRLAIAILPSIIMAIPFMCLEFTTGLLGTLLGSAQREWIARIRAESFLLSIGWFFLVGISLLSPQLFDRLAHSALASYSTWSAWLISTIGGILLGKSKKTNGEPKDEQTGGSLKVNILELFARIAPVIFIVGLFVLLAKLSNWFLSTAPSSHLTPDDPTKLLGTIVALAMIALIFGWRIDVNEFSMNTFYRDRLARCYAGASNPRRTPNPFTGFDKNDGSLRVAELLPLGWTDFEGRFGEYDGPFPIFSTAANLTTGKDLAYQERKASSFCLTPLFSGYSTGWTDGVNGKIRYNGFVPTVQHIKRKSGGITVASAVAISGAAASPNMGFHSSMPLAFMMTIFNVRLGWWLRNPRRLDSGGDSPRLGLFRLVGELFGRTNDTEQYLYLSDGGHLDNMGLYELIRRRCRTIIVCDAEADGNLSFEGIGMAIRKARLDFGVEIKLKRLPTSAPVTRASVSLPAVPNSSEGTPAASSSNPATKPCPPTQSAAANVPTTSNPSGAEGVLLFERFPGNTLHALDGEIIYPETPEIPGRLLYIKSTLTGDEPVDILNYHRNHNAFPFDSTLNQFFTESQFESYRRLGEHIILEDMSVKTWLDGMGL